MTCSSMSTSERRKEQGNASKSRSLAVAVDMPDGGLHRPKRETVRGPFAGACARR